MIVWVVENISVDAAAVLSIREVGVRAKMTHSMATSHFDSLNFGAHSFVLGFSTAIPAVPVLASRRWKCREEVQEVEMKSKCFPNPI